MISTRRHWITHTHVHTYTGCLTFLFSILAIKTQLPITPIHGNLIMLIVSVTVVEIGKRHISPFDSRLSYVTTNQVVVTVILWKLTLYQGLGCTRLAAASDQVYQLLPHGRWFSVGTPASSTPKTGRRDIAEILLKVAWNPINQIKSLNQILDRGLIFKVLRSQRLGLSLHNLISSQKETCVACLFLLQSLKRSTLSNYRVWV
jgi:hypothetical protein